MVPMEQREQLVMMDQRGPRAAEQDQLETPAQLVRMVPMEQREQLVMMVPME